MSEFWTHEVAVTIAASPARVHALLTDPGGWHRWNPGVRSVAIDGPFAAGSRFAMTLPDGEVIDSTVTNVTADRGFVDETVISDVTIIVRHVIDPLPNGTVRVCYQTQVSGPDRAEFGSGVTADFLDVLKGLKQAAETAPPENGESQALSPAK